MPTVQNSFASDSRVEPPLDATPMSSSGDAQDAAARVAALESELEATLEAAVRREALNAQTIKRAGPPVHTRVWPFLGAAPAARRGFLDFRGNRSAWFLNATFS